MKKTLFDKTNAGASLTEKLRGINLDSISLNQFRRIQRLLVLPEFDEEFLQDCCKGAVPLAVWCRSIGVCLARTRFRGRPEAVALSSPAPESNIVGGAELSEPPSEPPLPDQLHEKRRQPADDPSDEIDMPLPQAQTPHADPSSTSAQATDTVAPLAQTPQDSRNNFVTMGSLVIKPDVTKLEAWELEQVSELEVARTLFMLRRF